MTKEEIIEAFKFIVKKCDKIINTSEYVNIDEHLIDTVEDIAELCNRIIDGDFGDIMDDLKQFSLSSDLDEAAEGYVQTLCDRTDDNLRIDTTLQSAFKAGAKWMAKQGETIEN